MSICLGYLALAFEYRQAALHYDVCELAPRVSSTVDWLRSFTSTHRGWFVIESFHGNKVAEAFFQD
jgi:hypothetical protein